MSITKKKVINCLQCGKELKQKSIKRKFCSRVCSSIHHRKPVHKECECCGKVFKILHKKQRFCSHSCASLNLCEKKVPKKCGYCQKKFMAKII